MSVLEAAIGVISPPQCLNCGEEGHALCADCAKSQIELFGARCWRCNRLSSNSRTCPSCNHTGSPTHVWICTDHDNLARDLVSLYKFGHQRAAAGTIASLMIGTFIRFRSKTENEYLVVPIPTATNRIRERGFGHSELLARKISHRLRFDYSGALRRLDQTRQLGSKRQDRLTQLNSSFAVRVPDRIRGRSILLIDDVVTTGGTLISATKVLRAAGASHVDALLFAKRL